MTPEQRMTLKELLHKTAGVLRTMSKTSGVRTRQGGADRPVINVTKLRGLLNADKSAA